MYPTKKKRVSHSTQPRTVYIFNLFNICATLTRWLAQNQFGHFGITRAAQRRRACNLCKPGQESTPNTHLLSPNVPHKYNGPSFKSPPRIHSAFPITTPLRKCISFFATRVATHVILLYVSHFAHTSIVLIYSKVHRLIPKTQMCARQAIQSKVPRPSSAHSDSLKHTFQVRFPFPGTRAHCLMFL